MNGALLGQTRGSDTIVFLYDEKATNYGFDYNGTKYYYIFNIQGDVIGILNQSGTQIVSYQYDPWGKVLSVSGSEASTIGQFNPIRYRGYYYDTETGFYYLQSRYYDPITRRFLNADGIVGANQDAICYNLFAYCSNNPIMLTDESGNRVIWRFSTKARLEKVQNQRFLSKRARSYHLFNSSVLNFTKMSLISILITPVKKKLSNPTGFLHIKVKWLYAIH